MRPAQVARPELECQAVLRHAQRLHRSAKDPDACAVRLARGWKWQGREVEAAVGGLNLGDDHQEFRDTNNFSGRVYGSLSLGW